MRNLAALVEHERGACRTRRAAVHRARLHHQIVVGPVKRVGEQRLQPRRDRVAFDVAGDHAQLAGDRLVDRVQPADQRAVGDLRRQARNLLRVGAALRDFAEKLHQHRRDRDGGQLERPLEHRQVGIESLGCEQGAARRARHAHDTFDLDAACFHFVKKRFQRLALRLVLSGLEERRVFRRQLRVRAHTRQHFGDQPAARMSDQMQTRPPGARARQRQCVFDRAHAQRRMVQPVHAARVLGEQ